MILPIGTTLQNDKYRLDQILSQGHAGVTYRGTHLYLNQPVIIKTLNPESGLSPTQVRSQVQHFIGATQQLAKVQHPQIVRVRDLFLQSGVPYLAMDFVSGPTLRELSADHPLPQDRAIDYIWQAGSALQCLHQAGNLHGEIQPDHLIVSPHAASVVLVGFKLIQPLGSESAELRSPGYTAPEQSHPEHQWTPATDLYGLAATLYTLLTGQIPTPAPQRQKQRLREPRRIQPQISFGVEQAILKGMALNPQDRPQSIEAWLASLPQPTSHLKAALTAATAPAVPPSTAPQGESPADLDTQPAKQDHRTVARFPKRLLLWGAAIASVAGFGLGLFFRFQYQSLLTPAQLFPRSESPFIQEPFLPKRSPVGGNLDPSQPGQSRPQYGPYLSELDPQGQASSEVDSRDPKPLDHESDLEEPNDLGPDPIPALEQPPLAPLPQSPPADSRDAENSDPDSYPAEENEVNPDGLPAPEEPPAEQPVEPPAEQPVEPSPPLT